MSIHLPPGSHFLLVCSYFSGDLVVVGFRFITTNSSTATFSTSFFAFLFVFGELVVAAASSLVFSFLFAFVEEDLALVGLDLVGASLLVIEAMGGSVIAMSALALAWRVGGLVVSTTGLGGVWFGSLAGALVGAFAGTLADALEQDLAEDSLVPEAAVALELEGIVKEY